MLESSSWSEVVGSNPPRELPLLLFWCCSRMEIPLKPWCIYVLSLMEKIEEENSSPEPQLHFPKALEGVSQFPLIQALAGRRSRRFCLGAEIPDGPLAFKSSQRPIPLSELEQMVVLTSMAGSTGWHYTISYNEADPTSLHAIFTPLQRITEESKNN
jgi:hypothetical protein